MGAEGIYCDLVGVLYCVLKWNVFDKIGLESCREGRCLL